MDLTLVREAGGSASAYFDCLYGYDRRGGDPLMKHSRQAVMVLAVVCATALGTGAARAQDPVRVAPGVYKVVLENDRVRVLEVTLKPGEKVPMHSHPANVIYPLNAAKARFTLPDGKSIEVALEPGAVAWHEPETHSSENIGKTEARVLVIELKEASKQPKK